ncbi:MAG: ComEC/Rec2 family competence protein [Elusimicrobiales bacterium]|nr:ComEC/Rec2 family competence protein [Elusimicrobiales bacterium]
MRFSYYRRPLFVALMALMAFIWLRERLSVPQPVSACFGGGYRSEVRGRVAGFPSPAGSGVSFAFRASASDPPGCEGLLFVRLKGEAPRLGEALVLEGFGSEPGGARFPGGLDWASFLRNRGFRGEFRAGYSTPLSAPDPVRRSAAALRDRSLGAFAGALPPEKAAVMAGVVLGEKRKISSEDRRAFQDSGAMHLLVASGSNVGFVTLLVYAASSLAGLGRRFSAPLALAAAGLYVLAAGFDTPLLRAYLMFGAGLAGYAAGRESGAFQGLLLSALALLLMRPYSLFDASFQMSFLAAYSVTAGLGAWRPALEGLPKAARWALGLFLMSLFAQAVLAPALAWYFHRLSLVSPLSNLLLVPLSGGLMLAGFALSAFDGFPLLGPVSAWAVSFFSGLFLWLVRSFAELPFAAVPVKVPSAIQTAGWAMVCFVLLHLPLFRMKAAAGLMSAGALVLAAGFLLPGRIGEVSFSSGYGGASILSASGRSSLLVSSGMSGEDLAGAALASGFALPGAVLLTCGEPGCVDGLGALPSAAGPGAVYVPAWVPAAGLAAAPAGLAAEKVWPGDTFSGGGYEVAAEWPEGQEGYSVPGDRLAYRFSRGGKSFRAGPGGTLEGQK